jgi:hypothetical protein
MDTVAFGEAFQNIGAVLPDTLQDIACHADIQRAIPLARKDIDASLFHGATRTAEPSLSRG